MPDMPGYSDVSERASLDAPFSNGFEGEAWMEEWCSREGAPCVHDAQMGGGPLGASCPLIDVAIAENRTPAEWGERTSALGREMYTCEKYEAA